MKLLQSLFMGLVGISSSFAVAPSYKYNHVITARYRLKDNTVIILVPLTEIKKYLVEEQQIKLTLVGVAAIGKDCSFTLKVGEKKTLIATTSFYPVEKSHIPQDFMYDVTKVVNKQNDDLMVILTPNKNTKIVLDEVLIEINHKGER